MANVKLPANQAVDLYAATGITVGVQIKVVNITPNDVRLYSTGVAPVGTEDHLPVLFRGLTVENDAGDPGAWAVCVGGGAIDVREV